MTTQKAKIPRREFLFTGGAALSGAGLLASDASADSVELPTLVPNGATVLFQGDSITDSSRDRGVAEANHPKGMGKGYAFLSAAQMLVDRPDDDLKFFNRGVSGNKVHQLADRWQQDAIDLKPNVVSILIGVNDIWHQLNGNYDGTIDTYRNDFHALAERTKNELSGVKLVICEPFVLKTGAVGDKWFPKFDEFRSAAREVADKHADVWVPFQTTMDRAAEVAPPSRWAGDGVHPSFDGAALLANAWLQAVGHFR